MKIRSFTPREIVSELDRYIVGQDEAKKAVAIALRNRWRRQQIEPQLREEILPKNIILSGPTGCGKTEIARRLAKLAQAPFIKVEATKYTEVGYVGRDVDSMIRDLTEVAYKMCKDEALTMVKVKADDAAEEIILDVLLPPVKPVKSDKENVATSTTDSSSREKMRTLLRKGMFDDKEIEVNVAASPSGPMFHMFANTGMDEMAGNLQDALQNAMGGARKKTRKMKVKDAFKAISQDEAGKLIDKDEVQRSAIELVEQSGIVFIDEIDKVAGRENAKGTDVSREGVQRDILPIVEGSSVTTKYGAVKTDHILFIAAGAFHMSKPSDLIPELQGRFPIRVELSSLSEKDFIRILTEPENSLVKQYTALLSTEKVEIKFTKDGLGELAKVASTANKFQEDIGARRLYTVMEKLLEEESFFAPDRKGSKIKINAKLVKDRLSPILQNEDLSKFIL